MLRAAVASKTPLGLKAKEAMDKGALVTDELILDEMLKKRGTGVDKVLNFAIDDSVLEERITGRWIHPSSGRSYHTKFAPPKTPGVDDVKLLINYLSSVYSKTFVNQLSIFSYYFPLKIIGEPLIQRKDDNAEVLRSRLAAFHTQTEPVIDYYAKKAVLTNKRFRKHCPRDEDCSRQSSPLLSRVTQRLLGKSQSHPESRRLRRDRKAVAYPITECICRHGKHKSVGFF
ncbi:hypothetical protein N665_1996s0004 [Sinapis alba]|nr:hypothetical protein N665_1996s0004 [Sinapis alba]